MMYTHSNDESFNKFINRPARVASIVKKCYSVHTIYFYHEIQKFIFTILLIWTQKLYAILQLGQFSLILNLLINPKSKLIQGAYLAVFKYILF